MAKTTDSTSPSRYHNLSNADLADMIGKADNNVKFYEAERDALKAELKARKIEEATGAEFSISFKEQISARLDTKAVRAHLGALASKFEVPSISAVLRIKPVRALIAA